MINHNFRDPHYQVMSAFMHDIINWSETLEEQHDATYEVLQWLCNNMLCIAPDLCKWGQHKIEYLAYMIAGQGIEITNEEVQTLKEIKPVNSLKDFQHILGFANFYGRFIKKYSKIILFMTNSMSFDTKDWQSTPEIKEAQKQLFQAFTTAPVL